MTGFGKAQCRLQDKTVTAELKSLNGKYLDIQLKIPAEYKSREQDIRGMLAERLGRGKAELIITFSDLSRIPGYSLNHALMKKYHEELISFAEQQGIQLTDTLIPAILRLPEVVRQEMPSPDDSEWREVAATIRDALDACDAYRLSEGRHMEEDLSLRIGSISSLRKTIPALDVSRKKQAKQKLLNAVGSLRDIPEPDPNRFEQEVLYYLERLDINEELVRLEKHLSYFMETLAEPASAGKKLGFIAQEIGREINTIGSKANDASIQKVVVQMKDELEKVKEQLMNIL